MTHCKHCGYSFQAENGWQEFCSQECAMLHYAGIIIPCGITINDSVNWRLKQAVKDWHGFLSDESNLKLVRWGGERARDSQVGRLEQCIYRYHGDDGKWHEYMINVGSEIKPKSITILEYE